MGTPCSNHHIVIFPTYDYHISYINLLWSSFIWSKLAIERDRHKLSASGQVVREVVIMFDDDNQVVSPSSSKRNNFLGTLDCHSNIISTTT